MRHQIVNKNHEFIVIAFSILVVILTANVAYITLDALIKDDAHWYYWASEGIIDWTGRDRSAISQFTPIIDNVYAWGMIKFGPIPIRFIYCFMMALCSIFAFSLYRYSFGIPATPSFLSAVIPNILLATFEIPTSLNSSYAVPGLLLILASMLTLHVACDRNGKRSGVLVVMSILFYLVAMNTGPQNLFIP